MGIFSSDEKPSWEDIYNLQVNKVMLELKIDKLEAENDKLRTCLQEIKWIVPAPKPFIDFSEIKTATEVKYDYATICNELELRLHKILELITKAESEG